MGIENIGAFAAGDDQVDEPAVRPTDQEIKDKQNAELEAQRDEHNRRTGGGKYAKPTS